MQSVNLINSPAVSYQNKKLNSFAQGNSHCKSSKNPDKPHYANSDIMSSGFLYLSSTMRKGIKGGSFMENNQVSDEKINKRLNFEFDAAVKTRIMSGLIEFTDSKLPPLKSVDSADKTEHFMDIRIGPDARTEIMQENGKRLFITEKELRAAGRDEPTIKTAEGGIRLCDPYNQTNWSKVLQRTWPPADSTAGTDVLKRLIPVNGGNIIETDNAVGKEYGVHPSGIVITDKTKGRIYIFSRSENRHPDINWGTWVIAPFKVSKENGAVVLIPHNEKDDTARTENNPKWEKRGKYMLLDTLPAGEMSDIIGSADHAIIAKSGSKDAFMIRRLSGPNGKIKVYCPGGKNCEYVELEHMGPEVPSPGKSTIAYVIDFIPKEFIPDEFSKERKTLKEQTVRLAEQLD